jgi:formylmethanofuran dehydrogenase subunit A
MFRSPRHVLKAGEVVAEKGELRAPVPGETFCADLPAAPVPAALAEWFERYGSYRLAQLGLREDEVASLRAVERTVAAAPLPPIGKGPA